MAFPLTHLCVAWEILKKRPMREQDAAQFLLGSISPDAVHHREEFKGDAKATIGATKKITHLCPVSNERWGQVTDNDGWVECVKNFLREHNSDCEHERAFARGYAVHALTDIFNNQTIWANFRTKHPDEAAKGYNSAYYTDLYQIDARMFREFPGVPEIFALLKKAEPAEISGLVYKNETDAIRNSMFAEPAPFNPAHEYRFVTWEDNTRFIEDAAAFCLACIQEV